MGDPGKRQDDAEQASRPESAKEDAENKDPNGGKHDNEASTEKEGGVLLTLEQIRDGDIREMATDKLKSRLLQRTLLRGGPEIAQLVYEKAEPSFMELVHDQYGNYLTQKILEVATTEQFDHLFGMLKDELTALAQDTHGTRAVQKVVEQTVARGKVQQLLDVLTGTVTEELSLCVTGFHVVVKLIEVLPAAEVDGVLAHLCGTPEKALALGKDQWGCCVVKKCLDRAEGTTKQMIVDAVASNTLKLVQDPFGNYVVQHLIISGQTRPNPNVTAIVDALKGNMFELSLQKFSSNVLEKCLLNSPDKDRDKIINEILNPKDILPSEAIRQLLFHQYGNYVFQQALEVAKDPQFSLLIEHSKQQIQDLIRTPHGEVQATPSGGLATEHACRLAMKLVKRYPALSQGMAVESNMPEIQDSWANYGYYMPYGMDPYANWGANYVYAAGGWDPNFAAVQQQYVYPPMKGSSATTGAGGRDGRQRRKASEARRPEIAGGGGGVHVARPGAGGFAHSAAVGGSGGRQKGGKRGQEQAQTMRVGRIVGFWPNYTVTYDEIPAPGGSAGGSSAATGGRGRPGKPRAKTRQKKE